MLLVESSNTEVSSASEVPQSHGELIFRKSRCCVFARKLISLVKKVVDQFYGCKTRICVRIAITYQITIEFSLKLPKTSFSAVRAHFLTVRKNGPWFFLVRDPNLILVLKSDSHSESASVCPFCNPWPIQLYSDVSWILHFSRFPLKFTKAPLYGL